MRSKLMFIVVTAKGVNKVGVLDGVWPVEEEGEKEELKTLVT